MRILIVSDVTSWMPGGVPAETRDLINGLVGRGHDVALASDSPLRGAAARHFEITIPVTSSFGDQLRGILVTFQPDFVHVICMSSKGVLTLTRILRSHRWSLTVHSIPPYERKLRLWHGHERLHYAARSLRFLANTLAWQWIFRLGRIPSVIVHSKFVFGAVARYGFPKDRIALILLPFHPGPAVISAAADANRSDGVSLVTVAGLAHTKGQHDVVKALPSLLKRFPGLSYQLIGEIRDDTYVRWLGDIARELGVADHVRITPDLSQEDKAAVLARADVYVQPSHEEGFCLAFAEAAAVVARLVGTDAGAIAAMSRDDPGARVVAPRDPEAIAHAVASVLEVDLPSTHMADRAERLAARFSYEGYLQAHEARYAA